MEAMMPKIHDAYPLAALSGVDYEQANSWGTEKEGKLLAQPFRRSILDPKNHSMIRLLILAAVVEITKATKTTVGKLAMRTISRKVPTAFLIYNLMEAQKTTLLERSIWSLMNITFQVLPLIPICPNYLFHIKGLPTQLTTEVQNAILEVWHDEETNAFIDTVCMQQREPKTTTDRLAICNFMDMLIVVYQDIRTRGNIPMPSFCIYTDGNTINNSSTWINLRKYLGNREYRLKFQEPRMNKIPSRHCGICHGVDHLSLSYTVMC